eukprot:CAMPEP_0171157840 /NCGR_PEP_ID=MMETSP0790-20130122/2180_1 /TAXON_ID=2925 /ORGANISM="Alexandrium catenella, Strain OF101" /LENGTH=47 /DNA_ID= /DNA_START= /DNA_END= /DNA_ORIENTATION=
MTRGHWLFAPGCGIAPFCSGHPEPFAGVQERFTAVDNCSTRGLSFAP